MTTTVGLSTFLWSNLNQCLLWTVKLLSLNSWRGLHSISSLTKNKIHANYHISSTLRKAPPHSVVAPRPWPTRSSAPEQQLPVEGASPALMPPQNSRRLANWSTTSGWKTRTSTNALMLVSQSANSLLRAYLADRSRRFKRACSVSQPVARCSSRFWLLLSNPTPSVAITATSYKETFALKSNCIPKFMCLLTSLERVAPCVICFFFLFMASGVISCQPWSLKSETSETFREPTHHNIPGGGCLCVNLPYRELMHYYLNPHNSTGGCGIFFRLFSVSF